MTNQLFCYWLQGYFEISNAPILTKEKALLIKGPLNKINEPLGHFTQWLATVLNYFSSQGYRQDLLNYFLPEIMFRLNSIFHHVIDHSYETNLSLEEMQLIHDGHSV